jgi:hypothetical protein
MSRYRAARAPATLCATVALFVTVLTAVAAPSAAARVSWGRSTHPTRDRRHGTEAVVWWTSSPAGEGVDDSGGVSALALAAGFVALFAAGCAMRAKRQDVGALQFIPWFRFLF